MRLFEKILVLFIRAYQVVISPIFPSSCRYYPTCSEYSVIAMRRYGPLKGTWMGFRRILRCHPFNPGGYDPVE